MTKTRETTRIIVNYHQYRMIREVLKKRQIYFMAGSASIYVPSRREKYIITHNHLNQPIAKEWPDLNGEILWMTPGEAARVELERDFGYIKKVGWPSKMVRLFDWRWPMVFAGNFHGQAVYTDLRGAYHQCYRRLWLDVAFPRGRGRLSLSGIADRLGKWKLARNSLIGVVRAREGAGYRGSVRYKLQMGNKFLSPGLWATVQAWLNEIAQRAVDTGAIYVNTDGYIHPVDSQVIQFQKWLEDYELLYQTEAGDCSIVGWGNYRVGSKQTKHNVKGLVWKTDPFNTIQLADSGQKTKILDFWRKYGVYC